mgnify:FL=1
MHPLNQPNIDFISKQDKPVATMIVTKEDAEIWFSRDLTSDEWLKLHREIEHSCWYRPIAEVLDRFGDAGA